MKRSIRFEWNFKEEWEEIKSTFCSKENQLANATYGSTNSMIGWMILNMNELMKYGL